MKYCPYCGKELPEGAKFCVSCGANLTEEIKARTPEQPEAPKPSIPAYQRPRKKRGKKILAVVVCLIVIGAIIGTFLLLLQKPQVSVTGIKYHNLTYDPVTLIPTSLTLVITLNIDNPNPIGAWLDKVEGEVYYNNDYLGTVYKNVNREIKASGATVISVYFTMTNLPLHLSNPADIRVVGTAYISKWVISHKIGFDETRSVALSDIIP